MADETPEDLKERLVALRNDRRTRQREARVLRNRRRALTPEDRALVLAKTASRCHICGGKIDDRWQADHVLAHSGGGQHSRDNFLAAHALCNNYRWDYSSEEFQWVLKIGVWARYQMEGRTRFGADLLRRFFEYERSREKRRKTNAEPAAQ